MKGVYLLVLRPAMTVEETRIGDRIAVSLWTGAAIVNTLQLVFPLGGVSALLADGLVSWAIWQSIGP